MPFGYKEAQHGGLFRPGESHLDLIAIAYAKDPGFGPMVFVSDSGEPLKRRA